MARDPFPFAINTYGYTASYPAPNCVRHLAVQGYTGIFGPPRPTPRRAVSCVLSSTARGFAS